MSLKTAFACLPATIFIKRCISRPLAARWRTRFDVAPCPSYDEVAMLVSSVSRGTSSRTISLSL
jgi:hypothetical protein